MGEYQTLPGQASLDEAVRSYALWWREAGLHTPAEFEAHGWRTPPAAPFWQREPEPVAQAPAAPVQRVAEVAALAPAKIITDMPGTLPAFLDWLEQGAGQPEASWDGPAILPAAEAGAKMILVLDMPMQGAMDAATLIDAGQRRFLDAMLTSLGTKPGDAAIVTLATRRPPGGLIDDIHHGQLVARMRHYLSLARPGAAIILGDRTSRALLGTQGGAGPDMLREINHAHGTLAAIALPATELLMSRPAAKARSWQSLRLLHGILNG